MLAKKFNSFILATKPFRFHRSSIPPWINRAISEIGHDEIAGDEDNIRIIEYLKTVDLKLTTNSIDEIPWCSAFVNWVMEGSGYSKTGNALARSWLSYGKELIKPIFGCIVVLKRGNKAWMGHVGFLLDYTRDYVTLLGGNQKDRVGINMYYRKNILGFRWVADG